MSSYDGGGFDEWVEDSLFSTTTKEKLEEIKILLEPYRELIDNKLDSDFEPETMSWRTYRNALWSCISEEVNRKIAEILARKLPPIGNFSNA
jgi:hypothetical protein